jgi:putative iron-regulated protein
MSRSAPRSWAALCVAVGVCAATVSSACSRGKPEQKAAGSLSAAETDALRAALATYAEIAFASYSDAVGGAKVLARSVEALLAAPSVESLAAARKAWLSARHPYQQTEVFRFYDGPIDGVELRINTWPIDEGYVDGSGQTGILGIIGDRIRYPDLTTELLATLNGKDGETSISTGYHVLEFLLWGSDRRADGPGDRSYTDYVGKPDEAAGRRSRYLRLAVELLIRDLEEVRDAWAPGADNYRATFSRLPPILALGLALKGMGALSGPELGGERLSVAYETKAQENEHSCFSDNTVADLADDTLGIQNVCRGEYVRANGEPPVRGPGLCAAVAARSPVLGARLRPEIAASVEKVRAIPAPFDQAILGDDTAPGRVAVQAAIACLEAQTQTLAEVAAAYDVRLSPAASRRRP